jgi:hypothetical protein
MVGKKIQPLFIDFLITFLPNGKSLLVGFSPGNKNNHGTKKIYRKWKRNSKYILKNHVLSHHPKIGAIKRLGSWCILLETASPPPNT